MFKNRVNNAHVGYVVKHSMADRDREYMERALFLAQQAHLLGEIPVGAVIVDAYGQVIGDGYNMVEALGSQLEHAEARAVRAAAVYMNNWRLEGCSVYVTLEPCMMCTGLLALSRVERVIYAVPSPRFGALLDNSVGRTVYTRQIKCVTSGVCAVEATMLLDKTFEGVRERHGF